MENDRIHELLTAAAESLARQEDPFTHSWLLEHQAGSEEVTRLYEEIAQAIRSYLTPESNGTIKAQQEDPQANPFKDVTIAWMDRPIGICPECGNRYIPVNDMGYLLPHSKSSSFIGGEITDQCPGAGKKAVKVGTLRNPPK